MKNQIKDLGENLRTKKKEWIKVINEMEDAGKEMLDSKMEVHSLIESSSKIKKDYDEIEMLNKYRKFQFLCKKFDLLLDLLDYQLNYYNNQMNKYEQQILISKNTINQSLINSIFNRIKLKKNSQKQYKLLNKLSQLTESLQLNEKSPNLDDILLNKRKNLIKKLNSTLVTSFDMIEGYKVNVILSNILNKKLKIIINGVRAKIVELNDTIEQIMSEGLTKQQAKLEATRNMNQERHSIISNDNFFNDADKFENFKTAKYSLAKKWTDQIKTAYSALSDITPRFKDTTQDIDKTKDMVAKNDDFLNILEKDQLDSLFPTLPEIFPGETLNKYIADYYETSKKNYDELQQIIFTS